MVAEGRLPSGTQRYATDGHTFFVLQSTGPDGDYDVNLSTVIDSSLTELDSLLGPHVYDRSNGTLSNGDVLRWSTPLE